MSKIRNIILISFISWFFAGYDLVLLPLLAKEIGASFFPSINPVTSILAVYGTFSLSLLARFFGGYLVGGAADSHGRKPIVILCLLSVSILMLISAFLPSVHDVEAASAMDIVIAFIILRILIGFFIGGLWPTAAIFSMEKLYNGQKEPKPSFEEFTKKRTRASAVMQLGFHAGHLSSAFLVLVLLSAGVGLTLVPGVGLPLVPWWINYMHFNDAYYWRILSLIGGLFGILWTTIGVIYIKEEKINKSVQTQDKTNDKSAVRNPDPKETKPKSPLKLLLSDKDSVNVLISFWLILSGLLYMFYSTITILPEMLVRNNILMPIPLPIISPTENYPLVIIVILISTLGAHLWLGFFCHSAWNASTNWINKKPKELSGYFGRIVRFLILLREKWFKFVNDLATGIGLAHTRECLKGRENHQNEDLVEVIRENIDLMTIVFVGFLLIICGSIGAALLSILIGNTLPGLSKPILLIILIPIIMVANSGWALIPSSLSSRFPEAFRATASNLAYNGGLVIGFASPFIMLENFLSIKYEWLVFIPMILGAFAMIIGATRLINLKHETVKDRFKEKKSTQDGISNAN